MNLTVDKFGRIVLPKSLRVLLGLTPGKQINIEVTDEGFIAKPVVAIQPILVEEDGFLFVKYVDDNGDEADIDVDIDFDKILQDARNERIDKIIKPLL